MQNCENCRSLINLNDKPQYMYILMSEKSDTKIQSTWCTERGLGRNEGFGCVKNKIGCAEKVVGLRAQTCMVKRPCFQKIGCMTG